MKTPEYRIEFTIQRQQPGEDDFTDIGFGSSGGWNCIEAALYAVQSQVQNQQWETEEGMPDPEDIPLYPVDEEGKDGEEFRDGEEP